MGTKLTKAQRRHLENFRFGWTIAHPGRASAPIRRLIHRNLIAKTGVVRGRPYFAATDAGLKLLREASHDH